MSKYPGVPEGTTITPMTYDDDSRVDLKYVTISKPDGRKPGAVWAGDVSLAPEIAQEAGLAATILAEYVAGNAQVPTDAERLERRALAIAEANRGADPAAMRRAADLLEEGLPGGG